MNIWQLVKNQRLIQQKFFQPVIWVVMSLATLVAHQAQSAQYSIGCEDIDNPATCSLDGVSSIEGGFVEVIQELVETIQGGNTSDACEFVTGRDDDANYLCSVGGSTDNPLLLACNVREGDEGEPLGSARCNIDGLEDAFFLMGCNEQENNGGSCTISTDEEAIAGIVSTTLTNLRPALLDFGTNLIAGCALRAGTEDFQRDCDTILASLSDDPDAVTQTLEKIAPLNATDVLDSTFYTTGIQISHVTTRLARLRMAQRTKKEKKDKDEEEGNLDASQLKFFDGQQWVKVGDMLASNDSGTMSDVSPPSTFDDFSRVGFFIDGAIVSSEKGDSDEENGADLGTQLLTWGVDYRFSSQLIGGVAFSAASSEVDFSNNRGDLEDTGYMVMAYGSFYRDNWFVDASVGLGGDDYDQTRVLNCDSSCTQVFNQKANARFSGEQLAMALNAGYNWYKEAWGVMPYAQLSSVNIDIDSYRETMSNPEDAGSGYALEMETQNKESLSLTLGTQVTYVSSQSWGVWIPYADVQIFKEFNDDPQVVEGRFVGNLAAGNFTINSNETDTDYYLLGVGSTFQLKRGSSAFVNIQTMQGNDNLDQVYFTAGWRWEI